MLINGGEQRLNIFRKCEALSLLVRQRLSHLNALAMRHTVPRPRRAGAGHGEQLHTSADIVTCDNPLWADKVREVSQGTVHRLGGGSPQGAGVRVVYQKAERRKGTRYRALLYPGCH